MRTASCPFIAEVCILIRVTRNKNAIEHKMPAY
jgi:hypothetical protein